MLTEAIRPVTNRTIGVNLVDLDGVVVSARHEVPGLAVRILEHSCV